MDCEECGAPGWVQTLLRPRPQRKGPLRYVARTAKVHRFELANGETMNFWHYTDAELDISD